MRNRYKMWVLSLLPVIVSCSSTMGDFSVLSTRNVSGITDSYQKLGECEAKDGILIILIIPFGKPSLKNAIEKCIAKYPSGEFLMNARTSSYWWAGVLMGGEGFKVKGDVYGRR